MGDDRGILSLISLAKKAGKVKSGEFAVEEAIKSCRASLVIVAEDASENTKSKFYNKSEYYEIPMFFFSTKENLGHAIGKEMVASIAIMDEGLAKALGNKRR